MWRCSFALRRRLFLTGEYHRAVADTHQPSFKRRWQRTAGVIFVAMVMPRVDAENVDENDGEANDEREQRPKHAVNNGRLRHHVQDCVARVIGVGKADITGSGVAVPIAKSLHCSDVVLDDTVALVKWALNQLQTHTCNISTFIFQVNLG